MGSPAPLTADRVLRHLEWHVIRRLDGRLQGDYRTLVRGQGTDFREVREYEPGDDVRHVDWNVSARMDALYVREYTEDRELAAWLLLDRSPSMGFGPVDRTKEQLLCDFTTTIARLLIRNGNRVGALVDDNKVLRTIPPRHIDRRRPGRRLRPYRRVPEAAQTLMSVGAPKMFVFLLAVPAVVAWYVAVQRRRAERVAALAGEGLVTTSAAGPPRRRRHV